MTEPGSLNRYAFVEGDPVNFVDTWGLSACSKAAANLAFLGAVSAIGLQEEIAFGLAVGSAGAWVLSEYGVC
jgi:hypothetical protein